MNSIRSFLSGQRRQLFISRLLRSFGVCLLIASVVVVPLASVAYFRSLPLPGALVVISVLAGSFVVALLITIVTQPSLLVVAADMDSVAKTNDRLLVGLALENLPWRHSMEDLAYSETLTFLEGPRAIAAPRWRIPRELLWVTVPAAAITLLYWSDTLRERQQAEIRRDSTAEAVADVVRKLAAEARKNEPGNPGVETLAEKMEQQAKKLDAFTGESRLAQQKESLAALSALEAELKKSADASKSSVGAKQREALARALENTPSGAEAANSLRNGAADEAAKSLEQFLAQANAGTMAQLGENLSREMQQAEAQSGESGQAMTGNAREMIQQTAKSLSNKGEKESGEQRQQSLRSMTTKVAAIKQDVRDGKKPEGEQPDMFAFEPGDGSGAKGGAVTAQPGSVAASNPLAGTKDTGTTKDPFGDKTAAAENGASTSIAGIPGDGETMQAMIAATGGNPEARRRYKEIYEAALPEARDAVLREDIPSGLRLMVRKYFESIRPKE